MPYIKFCSYCGAMYDAEVEGMRHRRPCEQCGDETHPECMCS